MKTFILSTLFVLASMKSPIEDVQSKDYISSLGFSSSGASKVLLKQNNQCWIQEWKAYGEGWVTNYFRTP